MKNIEKKTKVTFHPHSTHLILLTVILFPCMISAHFDLIWLGFQVE